MRLFKSLNLFNLIGSFLLVSSSTLMAVEQPVVEVITSDAYPITGLKSLKKRGVQVQVYNLDDGKRLVAGFAKKLPPNQKAAKQALEQNFKQIGEQNVKRQFMQAYQGVSLSTQYGLSRYPAVVFNRGQSVVYGVTDVNQAFNYYQQWKK